jgi:phosphoribosylaminoimidazole (AIR) synthetase
MGLGMVLVVPPDGAVEAVSAAGRAGTEAWTVGRVTGTPGLRLRGVDGA